MRFTETLTLVVAALVLLAWFVVVLPLQKKAVALGEMVRVEGR